MNKSEANNTNKQQQQQQQQHPTNLDIVGVKLQCLGGISDRKAIRLELDMCLTKNPRTSQYLNTDFHLQHWIVS